jgi:hypothetical protein
VIEEEKKKQMEFLNKGKDRGTFISFKVPKWGRIFFYIQSKVSPDIKCMILSSYKTPCLFIRPLHQLLVFSCSRTVKRIFSRSPTSYDVRWHAVLKIESKPNQYWREYNYVFFYSKCVQWWLYKI